MKIKSKIPFVALALLAITTLNPKSSTAFSQGTAFTYQGRLASGNNAANGSYDLEFSLYNVASGGSTSAGPVTNSATTVSNGLFTTLVDFGPGVFTGGSNWLEIAVRTNGAGSFSKLAPRQPLTPTPYAIDAENATTLANGVAIGAGSGNMIAPGGSPDSFIGGGMANLILSGSMNSAVVGGQGNMIQPNSVFSFIGGGFSNQAASAWSVICGGNGNLIGPGNMGGTIGGGVNNANNASYATVSGGFGNSASGMFAMIGGGSNNVASGYASVVGGGDPNYAVGDFSVVAGGKLNNVTGTYATVSGGQGNSARGEWATVSGGYFNSASGEFAMIGGGSNNVASGYASVVGGGDPNHATGDFSFIGSGDNNTAGGNYTFIGGGSLNNAVTEYSTVAGGTGNTAGTAAYDSIYATVGGGYQNTASGFASTVAGGYQNTASGSWSFAAGYGAQAVNTGSFVWADSIGGNYYSDRDNQFKIRAESGVVIDIGGSAHLNPAGVQFNVGSSTAVGLYVVTDSSDANAVFSNGGNGDIIKGFNSDNGGNPVFEVVNAGDVYAHSFNSTSDRNAKENFSSISPAEILKKVTSLPVSQWNFKGEHQDVQHIGPMAQDFHAAFGLDGAEDKRISLTDEGGVALAAIQGLNQKLIEKDGEIQTLKQQNDSLAERLNELEATVKQLAAQK